MKTWIVLLIMIFIFGCSVPILEENKQNAIDDLKNSFVEEQYTISIKSFAGRYTMISETTYFSINEEVVKFDKLLTNTIGPYGEEKCFETVSSCDCVELDVKYEPDAKRVLRIKNEFVCETPKIEKLNYDVSVDDIKSELIELVPKMFNFSQVLNCYTGSIVFEPLRHDYKFCFEDGKLVKFVEDKVKMYYWGTDIRSWEVINSIPEMTKEEYFEM
jgi:hypothetical protein